MNTLGMLLIGFGILCSCLGLFVTKQPKPGFMVKVVTGQTSLGKGWEIITFYPERPITIKENKQVVLYMGIKED